MFKAKKSVSQIGVSFAKDALRVKSKGEQKQNEKIMHVISDSGSDAEELRWYVFRLQNYEHILMEKSGAELRKKDFMNENPERESSSSAFHSALYKSKYSHSATRKDVVKPFVTNTLQLR